MEPLCSRHVSAGSNLKANLTRSSIRISSGLPQDDLAFGVGQISSLNAAGAGTIKEELIAAIRKKKVHEMHPDVNMIFFMLTNILTESTLLLCEGSGADGL